MVPGDELLQEGLALSRTNLYTSNRTLWASQRQGVVPTQPTSERCSGQHQVLPQGLQGGIRLRRTMPGDWGCPPEINLWVGGWE